MCIRDRFNRVSQYDAAISNYLSAIDYNASQSSSKPVLAAFPAQSNTNFIKVQDLRYGENPHQSAAFYRDLYPAPGSLVTAQQLQGKEPVSYTHLDVYKRQDK